MAQSAQAVQRLQHGGGGVALADDHQLGRERLKRRLDLCQIKHRAPWRLHHVDVCATALGNLVEQLAEAAEAADQHLVAGLDG